MSSIWPGSSIGLPSLIRYRPESGCGMPKAPEVWLTGPADQTVSTCLSGAPDGWVNLPTRGESAVPRTDRFDGESLAVTNGVNDVMPVGLNGNRETLGSPSPKRPLRSGGLAGSS